MKETGRSITNWPSSITDSIVLERTVNCPSLSNYDTHLVTECEHIQYLKGKSKNCMVPVLAESGVSIFPLVYVCLHIIHDTINDSFVFKTLYFPKYYTYKYD
jgi:hypothetical protein